MKDTTTITIGDPYDDEAVYIPGLDTREPVRFVGFHRNDDGTETVDVEVWNDIEGRYLYFGGVTIRDETT